LVDLENWQWNIAIWWVIKMPEKVTFTWRSLTPEIMPEEVFIAGTFNDWNPSSHQLTRSETGEWKITLDLAPGTYEYRFVVDGEWITDPACENKVKNPHGSYNSVLTVREKRAKDVQVVQRETVQKHRVTPLSGHYSILVVDDMEYIRKILKIELEEEGYNVITAVDGEDALGKVWENKVDLITLDIRMPNMDGIDFLGRLREADKKLPVIILTAYGTHKQDMVVWGADDYIVKSSDFNELKTTIKNLLQKYYEEDYSLRKLAEEDKHARKTNEQLSEDGRTVNKDSEKYADIFGAVAHSMKGEFLHIGTSIKDIRELASNSPDIQEECDMIERSVEYSQLHLRRLLNYLDMGKPSMGPIDVMELLSKTELLTRPRLSSSVQLEAEIGPNINGRTISANFEQLMTVLVELIQNSNNALRKKGGTIRLHLSGQNGEMSISVGDNGPGIPEEIKKDLFKKQVLSKTGSGVGLLLCNKVINALGGQLNLKTSSEEGTTITILLPMGDDKKED